METNNIYVFVGLGNPGIKYQNNRHNIGFMAIDSFAKYHKSSPFLIKFQGELSGLKLNDKNVFLFKPQTYMNLSGNAVSALLRFYKIPLDNVFVIHDDLDLLPGKVKIKQGGGSGGHNGLNSVDRMCGNNYYRIRLGIGHPGNKDLVSDFVLSNFTSNDSNWLDDFLWNIGCYLPLLLEKKPSVWLSDWNRHKANSP